MQSVGSFAEQLTRARASIADADYAGAIAGLRAAARRIDDFGKLSKLGRLVATIPAGQRGTPIKLALLGSSTLDQFGEALRAWLALEGFDAEIWIAPFDTVTPLILDPGSELYSFAPDIVWLFNTHRDVRLNIGVGDAEAVGLAVSAAVDMRAGLWRTLRNRLPAAIIENNADIPPSDVMGNFAGQAPWSQRNALRRYNLELAEAAPSGVTIFDLDHVSGHCGKARWTDPRYWYHSKHAVGFDHLVPVAFQGARLIAALRGLAKKCVVLDLDNTLWGGVIGDDGINGIRLGNGADGEAFVDIQRWAKRLKDRGIILAVSSKNEMDIARDAFANHPDMHLTLDDIAVFRANWDNKADNIRMIAETLNIGLDSLVFIDDNPVERALVRHNLPMVSVPELPEDPADYLPAIEAELYFETVGFSREDADRTRLYKANAERSEQLASFSDQSEYLKWLEQKGTAGELDAMNVARMAQLVGKSNQFNLTTIRYTESDLQAFAARGDARVRRYHLADRYGDNGLIAVVVLEAQGRDAEVRLWVMSCRVLARTMEEFICNDMIVQARAMGCTGLIGRFRPTAKNKLVSGLYPRLGFTVVSDTSEETVWRLAIDPNPAPLTTYVVDTAPLSIEAGEIVHV